MDDQREHPARLGGRPLSPGQSRRVRASGRRSCQSSETGVSWAVAETTAFRRKQQRVRRRAWRCMLGESRRRDSGDET
jgi:hypothetical protein